jgi:hypothetical protein
MKYKLLYRSSNINNNNSNKNNNNLNVYTANRNNSTDNINNINIINTILYKHPNILLLIQTKLNHAIAVYTSLSYCESVDMKVSKGLLISTHSSKAYLLRYNAKPVNYSK